MLRFNEDQLDVVMTASGSTLPEWEVGYPVPLLSGEVVTFQADRDELVALLDGMSRANKNLAPVRVGALEEDPAEIPLSEDLRLAQSAVLALLARLADLGASAVNLPDGMAAAIEYLSRSARFLGIAAEDAGYQEDGLMALLDVPGEAAP